MKKHLIIILMVLISFKGFAQIKEIRELSSNGNYTEALDRAMFALKNTESTRKEAIINKEIAIIYFKLNKGKKALKYIDDAIKKGISLNNDTLLSKFYNNKGIIFTLTGELDSCQFYTRKSLKLKEQLQDYKGMFSTYNNIGAIYSHKEEFSSGIELFKESLFLQKKYKSKKWLVVTYNNIGKLFQSIKKYDSASFYYDLALMEADSQNDIFIKKKIIKNLERLAEVQGNYQESYSYLKEYMSIWEEIYTSETETKIAELELQREKEQHEHTITIQQAQIQNNRILVFILSLLLFLATIVVFLYRKLRVKEKREREREQQINQTKREAFLNYIKGQETERMRIAYHFHDDMNNTLSSARVSKEDKDRYVRKAQEILDDTADEVFSITIEKFGLYGGINDFVLENNERGKRLHFSTNIENVRFPYWFEASVLKIVLGLVDCVIDNNEVIHLFTGIIDEKINVNVIVEKHQLNIDNMNLIAASLITLLGADVICDGEIVSIDIPLIEEKLKKKRCYELADS